MSEPNCLSFDIKTITEVYLIHNSGEDVKTFIEKKMIDSLISELTAKVTNEINNIKFPYIIDLNGGDYSLKFDKDEKGNILKEFISET